ncbi:MAG TPA: hypothetical protein VND15_01685 [Candidatus Acidoferrales bacterium]|nr:hypothetical protein [Candidatus Acidoferrales bacterium]
MKFNLFGKKTKVVVNGISVKWQGYAHKLDGMPIKARTFEFTLPFQNKTHEDMLTKAADFKAQKAMPAVIKAIEVSNPFKLVSVEPALPVTVQPDQKITLKMVFEAPDYNYEGPLAINLASDQVEAIHIEITKVIMQAKGKDVEIETSSRIMSMAKGQIFQEKVQMFKALSFGDTVSKVEISAPFKIVSTDPKLPFTLDQTNSYIATLFVQAPESSYAGTLVFTFS